MIPITAISRKTSVLPFLVLALSLIALSVGSILIKATDAPSTVIATYRVGVAALVLIPALTITSLNTFSKLRLSDIARTSLSGALLAAHFLLWTQSLKETSVANSVVLANTSPIWIALLGLIIGKVKPTKTLFSSLALCMMGALLVCWGGLSLGRDGLYGDGLATLAGIALAGYLISGSKAQQNLTTPMYMLLTYTSSAVILVVVSLINKDPLLGYSGTTMSYLLALGLISQLIGHGGPTWSLKFFKPSFVSLFLLGDLVISPFLALIIFGETLTLLTVAGCIVIVVGLVIGAKDRLN